MALKGVNERLINYQLKFTPERVKETLELRRQMMLTLQAAYITELVEKEDKVKSVLAPFPIPTAHYIFYHNFSREVYRAWKRFGGGRGLSAKVAQLIIKYKALGCIEEALNQIRFEVFAIPPPTP